MNRKMPFELTEADLAGKTRIHVSEGPVGDVIIWLGSASNAKELKVKGYASRRGVRRGLDLLKGATGLPTTGTINRPLRSGEALVRVPRSIREFDRVAGTPGEPHVVKVVEELEDGDLVMELRESVGDAPKGTRFYVRGVTDLLDIRYPATRDRNAGPRQVVPTQRQLDRGR